MYPPPNFAHFRIKATLANPGCWVMYFSPVRKDLFAHFMIKPTLGNIGPLGDLPLKIVLFILGLNIGQLWTLGDAQ